MSAGFKSTATKIAEVLEILNDGQWHTVEEIQRKMKLSKSQIQQITRFLKEYEFVTVDVAKKEMKLDEAVRKFLTEKITS